MPPPKPVNPIDPLGNQPVMSKEQVLEALGLDDASVEEIMEKYAKIYGAKRRLGTQVDQELMDKTKESLQREIDLIERTNTRKLEIERTHLLAVQAEYQNMVRSREREESEAFEQELKRRLQINKESMQDATRSQFLGVDVFPRMRGGAGGMMRAGGAAALGRLATALRPLMGIAGAIKLFTETMKTLRVAGQDIRSTGTGLFAGAQMNVTTSDIREAVGQSFQEREHFFRQYAVKAEDYNRLTAQLAAEARVRPEEMFGGGLGQNLTTRLVQARDTTGMTLDALGRVFADWRNLYNASSRQIISYLGSARYFAQAANMPTKMFVENMVAASKAMRIYTDDLEVSREMVTRFGGMLREGRITMQEIVQLRTGVAQAQPGARGLLAQELMGAGGRLGGIMRGLQDPYSRQLMLQRIAEGGYEVAGAGASRQEREAVARRNAELQAELQQATIQVAERLSGRVARSRYREGTQDYELTQLEFQRNFMQMFTGLRGRTQRQAQEMFNLGEKQAQFTQDLSAKAGAQLNVVRLLHKDMLEMDVARRLDNNARVLKYGFDNVVRAATGTGGLGNVYGRLPGALERQAGGIAPHGIYELGEAGPEFVLPADVVRDRFASIQDLMHGGAGGGANVTIEFGAGAIQVQGENVGTALDEAFDQLKEIAREEIDRRENERRINNPGF